MHGTGGSEKSSIPNTQLIRNVFRADINQFDTIRLANRKTDLQDFTLVPCDDLIIFRPRTEVRSHSGSGSLHMKPILLVEDNEDDVFLMKRALKSAEITAPVHIARDGQEALDYLQGKGPFADRNEFPFPYFVFLDLKLPRKPGLEVLEWIRQDSDRSGLVVIILTSSKEPRDLERANRLGANSYLVKPATALELVEMMRANKNYWLRFHQFPESGPSN
jgi:CheY-like chemotaxis protein